MDMTYTELSRSNLFKIALIAVALALVAVLRAGSALNYSTWAMDEHFVVPYAVGFLDGDLNPRWFGYHTLPMYITGGLYAVLYTFYELAGLVQSKVAFASLLFQDDAVFYVSARLLVSLLHTLGAFVLGLILYRHYRSTLGAVIVFATAVLLPDSVMAANKIRVDSYVFFFLCLLILFSCYSAKTLRNFLFSLLACAGAIASKAPALVVFPILLAALALDAYRGRYPKSYLVYALLGVPLLTLLFMPYAVLDFDSYRPALEQFTSRAGGSFKEKIGLAYYQDTLGKLGNIYRLIEQQAGTLSALGAALAGLYALLRRNRPLFFSLLFTLAYTAAFSTSASINQYWLRPVYPLYVFLTVAFVVELSRHGWLRALGQRLSVGGNPERLGTYALLEPLAIYYAFIAHPGVSDYYTRLTDNREDTRGLAGRWIREQIPEKSIFVMDTFLPHYLPRVFSPSPKVTLSSFDYPRAQSNQLLVDGFNHYFDRHKMEEKKYRVLYLNTRNYDFDTRKFGLPRNGHVVISSSVYDRYYTAISQQNEPDLTRRAQRFYDAVKRLEEVQTFSGRGPDIGIYRIR